MDRVPTSYRLLEQLVQGIEDCDLKFVDLSQPPRQNCQQYSILRAIKSDVLASQVGKQAIDAEVPSWYFRSRSIEDKQEGTSLEVPPIWEAGISRHSKIFRAVSLRRLVGQVCVIDISEKATEDSDYLLTRKAVLAWEEQYGIIPSNSWVLLRSDWSRRSDIETFLNIKLDGPHWPGFSKGCSQYLAQERNVLGVGVETADVDAGQAGNFDPPFWTRQIMHDHGKCSLFNLCNLDQLPPTGAILIPVPLNMPRGSLKQANAIALIPS
ncbi:MAG: cyclase family protein [Zoogloeaceae bacterium]|nr:cyclase family protein [Zoogloeaceae bacterium]